MTIVFRHEDRGFGLAMAAVLGIVWFWKSPPTPVSHLVAALAAFFALTAALFPKHLRRIRKTWIRCVGTLQNVVQILALALIYFGPLTAAGWLRRTFGREPISLRFEPGRHEASYWIDVSTQPVSDENLKRPF